MQHVTLRDNLGSLKAHFIEPFIDQELRQIGFAPKHSSVYRGLYPQGDESYFLRFHDGQTWRFDAAGNLIEQQTPTATIAYQWAGRRLTAITLAGVEERVLAVQLMYDETGRVRMITSSQGQRATYTYNPGGDLESVETPGETMIYRYNHNHLLINILVNGRTLWAGEYDELGHLVSEEDGHGARTVVRIEAGEHGKTMTLESEGFTGKQYYDSQLRLVRAAADRDEARYAYHLDGSLKSIELRDASGVKRWWEVAPDRRTMVMQDTFGTLAYRFDEQSRLSLILTDGKPLVSYRHEQKR